MEYLFNNAHPIRSGCCHFRHKIIQGVHKKSLRYVWKAIEPLRIEVGIKVRGVSESAGAELSWTYHNFSVAHLGPEIFEFKVGPVPKITFYNVIS